MAKTEASKEKKIDVADKTESTASDAVDSVDYADVNENEIEETSFDESDVTGLTDDGDVTSDSDENATDEADVKPEGNAINDVAIKPEDLTQDKPAEIGKLVTIVSKERAGKSIIATTGDIIAFDDKGIAQVKEEDAEYLKQIPGFEVK